MKNKTNFKIIIMVLAIGLSIAVGLSNYLIEKKINSQRILKEKQFEKDEYCRSEYTDKIKKEVAERWLTETYEADKKGFFVSLKEIFYSPSLNECICSYELNFNSSVGYSKEYVIALASTGDPIFKTIYVSTFEVDHGRSFSENVKSFQDKVEELKL